MIRLNQMLAVGAIGILSLTGCTATEEANKSAADSVVANTQGTVDAAKDKVTSAVSGFTGLNDVVTNTKAAVEAEDFAKAGTELGKFEGFWATIEDGVKAKSSATYDAVETNVSSAEDAIKASDKDKALSALAALGTAVTEATKP
jgi:high-affinity Fe2+/Pb2+ permease